MRGPLLLSLLVALAVAAAPALAAKDEGTIEASALALRGDALFEDDEVHLLHLQGEDPVTAVLTAPVLKIQYRTSGGFCPPQTCANDDVTWTVSDAVVEIEEASSDALLVVDVAGARGRVLGTDVAVAPYQGDETAAAAAFAYETVEEGVAFSGADRAIASDLRGDVQAFVYGLKVRVKGTQGGEPVDETFETGPRGTGFPFGESHAWLVVSEALAGRVVARAPGSAVGPAPVVGATGGAVLATPAGDRAIPGPAAWRVVGVDGDLMLLQPVSAAALPAATTPPDNRVRDAAAVGGAVAAVAAVSATAWYWPAIRYGATLLALPLYSRIERDRVMEHETRERIYQLIREVPGIHAHEISERAQVGWGTAVYHLKLLEDHRLVVSERQGRYKRFFLAAGYTGTKDAIGALRNPTTAAVAEFVARNPGTSQRDVCQALGISPSLVNWHVDKLEAAEVVKKVREGRIVRYFAGPAWEQVRPPTVGGPEPALANN